MSFLTLNFRLRKFTWPYQVTLQHWSTRQVSVLIRVRYFGRLLLFVTHTSLWGWSAQLHTQSSHTNLWRTCHLGSFNTSCFMLVLDTVLTAPASVLAISQSDSVITVTSALEEWEQAGKRFSGSDRNLNLWEISQLSTDKIHVSYKIPQIVEVAENLSKHYVETLLYYYYYYEVCSIQNRAG